MKSRRGTKRAIANRTVPEIMDQFIADCKAIGYNVTPIIHSNKNPSNPAFELDCCVVPNCLLSPFRHSRDATPIGSVMYNVPSAETNAKSSSLRKDMADVIVQRG